jgi:NaMN:DMB phosphoribosyltransferase
MMAGAMLGAAERGMLLLIDGFIVTSALLVAVAHRSRRSCLTACSATARPNPAIRRS